MFVLDTNVVSELRKANAGLADPNVAAWAARTAPVFMFISAITVLELEQGILLIERRDRQQGAVLRQWLEQAVLPSFAARVLPMDLAVARRFAVLHIPNPRGERDAMIAATALVHGMAVVTRNAAHFAIAGLQVINPWTA